VNSMKKRSKEADRHVQSVLDALSVLDCLQEETGRPLGDIASETKLNKSKVIRLCGTLEAKGYLVHDLETKNYRIGPRLLVLGRTYERGNPLISLARAILREVVHSTGESATLYVIEGIERLVLAREKGSYNLRHSVTEGQRFPIYTGASGKVLLAYGPENLRQKVLKKSVLRPLTKNTIVNPVSLRQEFEIIRKQGFGVSVGERSIGGEGLAAPVFDHTSQIRAALGIAGPVQRIDENLEKYIQTLRSAAQKLSAALGHKADNAAADVKEAGF
jgi:DNA-binding IclR family transcriptional regulator